MPKLASKEPIASATEILSKLGACPEARKWADGKSISSAWHSCDRADWLLWVAAKIGVDRKLVVRAACACARTSLKHVKPGEDRPRIAIETAERWCEGKATIEEVRKAAAAAAADNAAAAANAAANANAATRSRSLREMSVLVRDLIPFSAVAAAVKGMR